MSGQQDTLRESRARLAQHPVACLIAALAFTLPTACLHPDRHRFDRHDYGWESTQTDLGAIIALPAPEPDSVFTLHEALATRRSRRDFEPTAITEQQLSQLLWAAYGISEPTPDRPELRGGLRTTPSAGALYPLEIYVVVGNVLNLAPGVYRFDSENHQLVRTVAADRRSELAASTAQPEMIARAPVTLVYTAVLDRIEERYGQRGRERYALLEIGHSAQNVYLQAEALGLGTVAVAAFTDHLLSEALRLPVAESPWYLMPIGHTSR